MKYTYIGGVLKDVFYRRIPNSAKGNERAQKKALGTLEWHHQRNLAGCEAKSIGTPVL